MLDVNPDWGVWWFTCACCGRWRHQDDGSTDFFQLCSWCFSAADRLWRLLGLENVPEREYVQLCIVWGHVKPAEAASLPWSETIERRVWVSI